MCEVVVFTTKSIKVASLKTRGPISEQPKMWQKLSEFLKSKGMPIVGSGIGIYYDTTWNPEDVNYEICLPFPDMVYIPQQDTLSFIKPFEDKEIKSKELPSQHVASILHRGSYETMCESYKKLTEWIKTNGYKIVGPAMEVYLRCPHTTDDPAGYVTDIQFPIAK